MRLDGTLARIGERGSSRSAAKRRIRWPGWLSRSSIAQALIIVWLAAAAITVGWLLYLVNTSSATSIYRAAGLPALLVLLLSVVALFRIRRRYIPVILLVAAAYIPLSIPTGTESRLVVSLVLTIAFSGVWIVGSLVAKRRFSLAATPVNKPLMAFMGLCVVSLGWGMLLRDPLLYVWNSFPLVQLASTAVMIMLPAALLMVVNFVDDPRLLKAMVVLMLVAGVLGLPKQFGLLSLPVNTDGLYTMWVVALSIGLALFDRQLPPWLRACLLLLAGLWVYWGFILNVSWVAGWLPVLFCIALIVFFRSRPLFVLLAVSAVVLLLVRQNYYLNTVIPNEEVQSLYTRLAAWSINWSVAKDHLLFGTGPAGYAVYYVTYFPNQAMASHNNLLDVLSETGVFGLVAFMWFFFELVKLGLRQVRRLQGRGDFSEALAVSTLAGSVGALVMMGFGDWVIPFAYTQTISGFDHAVYTWLFMGAMLALNRMGTHPLRPSVRSMTGIQRAR